MREFRLDTIELADDCAVLRVTGEVDLYTAPALRERIRGLAASGAVHVIADLGQVDFLDSTALGVLIGGLKRLLEDGGSLVLVIKTSRILRVFELTALTKAFAISPSVAAAVSGDPHWRKTAETEAGSVDAWCRRNGLS